ncbi:MAG: GNAT family N-acetyltransferase [Anaerolinea sp.]|nr:GNAT family N-acetyltransferase [Anaerolinea sp.]
MTDLCHRLDWDSDFFGYTVGRADVNRLTSEVVAHMNDWCALHQIDCLYFLADPAHYETTWLTQANGFVYVDTRVTLTATLTDPENVSDVLPDSIRVSRVEDVPALQAIARSSHRDSRFYFDPVIPAARCDDLFATWIERSVTGKFADVVLVADVDDEPVGYCALQITERGAKLALIGVSAAARGQGLGTKLVRATLDWFRQHGYRKVEVVTQGRNVGAQRLYIKHGFHPTETSNWYHRWSPDILARYSKVRTGG